MDNSNDKTNQPSEENAIEVAPPSEIELVEEADTSTTATDTPDEPSHSLSRLELESLIQRYLDDSEKLKNQLKTQKEMYNAAFENDAEYSQETELANAAKKKVA